MWEFRSTGVTAPLTVFTIETRVCTRCPRRFGSKRTRFRASVLGTNRFPVLGCTATSKRIVPTRLTVRMTEGVPASASITKTSLSGSV